MVLGAVIANAVIANIAKHHEYPFHARQGIERPFVIFFFVLARATIDIKMVTEIGLLGIAYIVLRIIGKLLGATIGGQCSQADTKTIEWMGSAILPQAGVAIGMALVVANTFPQYWQILLPVVISSTIFFEIIGPVFTHIALERVKNQINPFYCSGSLI